MPLVLNSHGSIFYKVAINMDLASTKPLLLGKHRVPFLGASGHNISIN